MLRMLQNKTMASKRGKFDLKNVPLRSFNLRSQSVANKISLKEKLTAELALVRSAINKIKDDIPRTERCCKRASTNTHPSKQQQVSSSRKRKSSEITQGQLHFHVSNIDSKKSISTQGKRHCFNSNVLVSVGDAHKRNIQPMTQLKSSCDVGQKGFDKSFYKKELTPTKALRVAKLKSRFTDTIVKAQLELQNIGEKQRAFRMQREKDKLAKAYEEEKIRIEVQVKAVAAKKAKSELKMKIKKEREASRLALEKMEATIEIGDFNQVVKELKELGCQNISFYVLRQLGLFLKDDDFDDHKIAQIPVPENDDLEEGEIRI